MSILITAGETGGTRTRTALLEIDRASVTVLAVGEAPGANPFSVGKEAAARNWADALKPLALAAGKRQVDAGCLAANNGPELADAAHNYMLKVHPSTISDAQSALWTASCTGTGTVVIAGTGSASVAFKDGEQLHMTGGWGWWLGDEGSGTWIGRELLRTACEDIELNRSSPLIRALAVKLGVTTLTREDIIKYAHGSPDGVVGVTSQLAYIIDELDGDAAVDTIVERAAHHILHLGSGATDPIILSGSIMRTKVGRLAVEYLEGRAVVIENGLPGAAFLSAMKAGLIPTQSLHARILEAFTPALQPV